MVFHKLEFVIKSSATAVVLIAAVTVHSLITPSTELYSSTLSTTHPSINRLNTEKDFTIENVKNGSPTWCANFHSSIDEFPRDFFTEEQRLHGAVIVHLILSFYGFLFITFVCQDYFLPSVLYICIDLGLSPDVAARLSGHLHAPPVRVPIIHNIIIIPTV